VRPQLHEKNSDERPLSTRPGSEHAKQRAEHPKIILRPDVTVGELEVDVPAWCVPQDKFVVLSRATLLRAFGADASLLELHRRFRLECPHPGCRSPALELWVRFAEPGDRSCEIEED
jgi:hypothetical protein